MGRTACGPGAMPVQATTKQAARRSALFSLAATRWRAAFIWALSLLVLSNVLAQAQPANVQPGIPERERQERQPPRPPSNVNIPSVETPRAWEEAQSVRFVLNAVQIEGNAVIDDQTLSAAFRDLLGKEVSIGQVFAATEEITRLYVGAGYALSLAYVPAQEVRDGVVLIRVVEGFIGEVAVRGADAGSPRWDDHIERLKESRPLTTEVLERQLLLISDRAGVKATNFFERLPNGEAGAMRLVINVERKLFDARLEVNNRGSEAIGPIRAFVNFDLNDVLGLDERLGAFGVTTFSNELVYAGGRIEVPLWIEGTILSIEAARSESKPGTAALAPLDFQGTGWTGSGGLTHALIRSLKENLYLTVGFAYKNLKSQLLALPNTHDKISALSLGADYDSRDRRGGLWRVVANVLIGLDVFDATKKSDPFSSRAGASGRFAKLEGSVSHLASLSDSFSAYAELAGQIADGPLLVSEQCGYGGGYIGRAFDPFELTGDHCVKGRAELRYDLPVRKASLAGALNSAQLYLLADFGVMVRSGTLLPGEERTETAESVGLGVRFKTPSYFSGFVEVAHPLDRGTAVSGGKRETRIFFGVAADY